MTTPIDIREVVCGLVPTLLGHLAQATGETVVFHIRTGVRDEIVGALGTGGDWSVEIGDGLGCDVLTCTRRAARDTKPSLNLLDF